MLLKADHPIQLGLGVRRVRGGQLLADLQTLLVTPERLGHLHGLNADAAPLAKSLIAHRAVPTLEPHIETLGLPLTPRPKRG
jgi:hypothetical protein